MNAVPPIPSHGVAADLPAMSGRVLLAASCPDARQQLLRCLGEAGLEADVVGDGRAAVEASLVGDHALVLMETELPEMDGLAAAELLQAAGCGIPVVAITTDMTAQAVQRCRRAGCVDVLVKPLQPQRVHEVVARHLRLPLPALALDDEMARELQALTLLFRQGLPAWLAALDVALQCNDQRQLRELVHSLKGAAGSYGHPELTRLCAEAELALRAADAALLQACWASLRAAVQQAQSR